jgi:hypothetical protein
MLFFKKGVVIDENLFRILAVDLAGTEISFNDLMEKVKFRILMLLDKAIRHFISTGGTEEEAFSEIWYSVSTKLRINEIQECQPETVEEMAEIIYESPIFTDFYYRVQGLFLSLHRGVMTRDMPVAVEAIGDQINADLVEEIAEDDNLTIVLDGFDFSKNLQK